MCWLKSIIGGWCTSVRMHEPHKLECIYGCNAEDSMIHYLECPALWFIVNQHIMDEASICIPQRLCLQQPSCRKLQRLALCYGVYHACKNDNMCVHVGVVSRPLVVQNRAYEFSRTICQHIGKYTRHDTTQKNDVHSNSNAHVFACASSAQIPENP